MAECLLLKDSCSMKNVCGGYGKSTGKKSREEATAQRIQQEVVTCTTAAVEMDRSEWIQNISGGGDGVE